MISVKEASKWLGPQQKRRLQAKAEELAGAKKRVEELQALRALRLTEQGAAQPAAVVTATADPRALAQGQALAGAVASVIGQIDQDLIAAQQQVAARQAALTALLDMFVSKRRQIAELDSKIERLQAEREALRAELAT